jgi:hypothetical protein
VSEIELKVVTKRCYVCGDPFRHYANLICEKQSCYDKHVNTQIAVGQRIERARRR